MIHFNCWWPFSAGKMADGLNSIREKDWTFIVPNTKREDLLGPLTLCQLGLTCLLESFCWRSTPVSLTLDKTSLPSSLYYFIQWPKWTGRPLLHKLLLRHCLSSQYISSKCMIEEQYWPRRNWIRFHNRLVFSLFSGKEKRPKFLIYHLEDGVVLSCGSGVGSARQ